MQLRSNTTLTPRRDDESLESYIARLEETNAALVAAANSPPPSARNAPGAFPESAPIKHQQTPFFSPETPTFTPRKASYGSQNHGVFSDVASHHSHHPSLIFDQAPPPHRPSLGHASPHIVS